MERVWWGWSDWIGISLSSSRSTTPTTAQSAAPCMELYNITSSQAELQINKEKKSTSQNTHVLRATAKRTSALEPEVQHLLPVGQGAVRRTLGLHLLAEVELAAPGVDVDGAEADAELECAAVDLVADEEEDDDGAGEVALEEAFDIEIGTADGLGRG